MEITLPEWSTLDCNLARVLDARKRFTAIQNRSLEDRAAARATTLRETASADDGLSTISYAEGNFIDLAIHKDTFLDDAATQRDVTSEQALYWKSRYAPTTGVYMGSVYGGPPTSFYQTMEYWNTLQPFVVDTEEIDIPTMSLSIDPAKLQIRDIALTRQAEALKLKGEQFLLNAICGQPLGTDLASTIVNYFAVGNPYNGRTVYVADPGVRPGTYETTNLISLSSSGGLSPVLAENVVSLMQLMKRSPRTFHIPIEGQPWRKLFRYGGATLAINAPLTGPGNAGLNVIPNSDYERFWGSNFADGFVINWFGMPLKFKANNALPQGYGVITTDQPAAELIRVTNLSVNVDIPADAKNPYMSKNYQKQVWAIAVPEPWARNIVFVYFGNTSGL